MTVLTRKAVLLQGAIAAYLSPKMAQDARLDLVPILEGVTSKNFGERKPAIIKAVKAGAKLAKDAQIEDFASLLDACEKMEVAEGADIDPNSALPMTAEEMKKKAADEEMAKKTARDEKAKNFRESLSEDMRKAFDEMMETEATAGDEDETDEVKAAREAKEKKAKDRAAKDKKANDEKDDKVDKAAMDAAIDAAVKDTRRTMQEISLAKDDVEQYVGKLAPTLAFDSASDVYGAALKAKGVSIDGVHPSAYKAILTHMPKLGDAPASQRIAQDSAAVDTGGFTSRYGDLVNAA